MQTQKYEIEATAKQWSFIENLVKRGFVGGEVMKNNLTKKEASQIIDSGLALAKESALSEDAQEEASQESPQNSFPKEEFNKLRFGMCAKLVYSKQDFNLENAYGVKDFKSEVRRLYDILSEMERSLAPSSSDRIFGLSGVELLNKFYNKIPKESD